MQKENSTTTSRPRRFTITGSSWDNFYLYGKDNLEGEEGDTCIVRPGAPYRSGDLVLVECSCEGSEHYHAKIFTKLHGKKYSFSLGRREGSGKYHFAGEEKIIIGPVLKVIKKGQQAKAKKQAKQGSRTERRTGFDWPYFGVHTGDVLTVEHTKDVKPGQLILIKEKEGESDSYFHRVCCVNGETVRVTNDGEPHNEPLSLIVGKVVDISHDDCQQTKIEALRERLKKLGDDITDSTEAFKIEREIYALEHPLEEEEEAEDGDDEWSDEIDG